MREIAHVLRKVERGYVHAAKEKGASIAQTPRPLYGNSYRGYAGAYLM